MEYKSIIAWISAGILVGFCYGSIREGNIIRPSHTIIEDAQVDIDYFGQIDSDPSFDPNTVYLTGMPEVSSCDINYDALAEQITLDIEPVANGIFIEVLNHSAEPLGCIVRIKGREQRISCLYSGNVRPLFFDLDPFLFKDGFSINGKGNRSGQVTVEVVAFAPDSKEETSTLKYAIEESEVSTEEYKEVLELRDEGYCSFLEDGDMKDFILKFYCSGNLIAGSSMETTQLYRFGTDGRCFAVPVPEGIDFGTVEMEYYY